MSGRQGYFQLPLPCPPSRAARPVPRGSLYTSSASCTHTGSRLPPATGPTWRGPPSPAAPTLSSSSTERPFLSCLGWWVREGGSVTLGSGAAFLESGWAGTRALAPALLSTAPPQFRVPIQVTQGPCRPGAAGGPTSIPHTPPFTVKPGQAKEEVREPSSRSALRSRFFFF